MWAPIRLWSLTLRLSWWDGLTNRASQALPRKYIFENNFSLAHRGNSACRASGAGKESDIGMPQLNVS